MIRIEWKPMTELIKEYQQQIEIINRKLVEIRKSDDPQAGSYDNIEPLELRSNMNFNISFAGGSIMTINQAGIREVFSSFNAVFNKAFAETNTQYQSMAMEVPSEAHDETYAWLGSMPSMREWIGDRQVNNLAAHSYTIKNKTFEATVAVPMINVRRSDKKALTLHSVALTNTPAIDGMTAIVSSTGAGVSNTKESDSATGSIVWTIT